MKRTLVVLGLLAAAASIAATNERPPDPVKQPSVAVKVAPSVDSSMTLEIAFERAELAACLDSLDTVVEAAQPLRAVPRHASYRGSRNLTERTKPALRGRTWRRSTITYVSVGERSGVGESGGGS